QRDHHEPATVAAMFAEFVARTRQRAVVSDDANLATFARGALTFGVGGSRTEIVAHDVALDPESARLTGECVEFTVPAAGLHNVWNAVAAIAACRTLDVPLHRMTAPLA